METTDKISCNIVVDMLVAHGVTQAVVSPGSRNAPLVMALARRDEIVKTVVVDERSAAFIALGKASISGAPVVLVCTSGTAVLNYAPAVAEAYYRRVPLVVISADRPMEWIDQDDSQTLRQYEALSHYVKRSYDIPAECATDSLQWYVNRIMNDALLCAVSGRKAPVHINLQLDNPLDGKSEWPGGRWLDRVVDRLPVECMMPEDECAKVASRLASPCRVLIIAGFMEPDPVLNEAVAMLATRDNIVVMTESISNLKSDRFIGNIDATLSVMTEEMKRQLSPDVVITFGGAIVSRFVKQYLRSMDIGEHWHVGLTDTTIDCFRKLTLKIDMEPAAFFKAIASVAVPAGTSEYSARWLSVASEAAAVHARFLSTVPWCDLKATSYVFGHLPAGCNVQLSNGTAVRYAQLFDARGVGRCDCNRGVSGIDGSTSTAIGASSVFEGVTLFITGDMSAQYDVGALAAPGITPRFKMIVLCNGGGGIFRFIKSTSGLDELEDYFVVDRPFPLRKLADAYGFSYYEASSESELAACFADFIQETEHPAILALKTSGSVSASQLRLYFEQKLPS